jgi:vacuolar-type H+-ATPase subunit I/STV1
MDEQTKNELEELKNLQDSGILEENQQTRLRELNSWAEAEKTATEKSKELQSAIAQKEHFRSKHDEAQRVVESLKSNPSSPNNQSIDAMTTVRLSKALGGYNEEETDFIIRNSDRTPEGIIKSSQDDWVKDAIQARRAKVASQNKIPAPGSSSPFASTQKSGTELQDMLRGKSLEEQSHIMRKYEEEMLKEEKAQGV